ncbi:MAG: HD domain-containing phosphohydrolase [Kyrpidia sp.]|nr:HD domain-containing phosphohydrolase [Kyrpidia sp.]
MRVISVLDATPGMWLSQDVFSADGLKLIKRGTQLTRRHLDSLRRHKIREIHVGDPPPDGPMDEPADEDDRECFVEADVLSENGRDAYRASVRKDALNYLDLALEKLVHLDKNRAVYRHKIREIGRQLIHEPKILEQLTKLRAVGDGSLHHCVQVMVLGLAIAMYMKMDPVSMHQLGTAALVFDIGKCFVDRSIIMKRGPLTPEEHAVMREHVHLGYAALKEHFDHAVARVALEHHERYDGSGYPYGLTNERMHPFSRIISLADVFISLISCRVYRPNYDPHEAIEYIYGAGGHLFDPSVITALVKVVSLYTVGTVVQLNNGWVGVVKQVADQPPGRPVVEVIMDDKRRPLSQKIDLSQAYQLVIERVLEP